MAFQFHKIPGFSSLANRRDARDIGNGLSKAQNISLDVGGKVRTIGGLEDFTKVDGTTALTQTAKLCPGSSLFTYGSDHWRGTDTVVDLIATSASDDSAASDQYGEADDVGDWAVLGGGVLVSQGAVVDEGSFALHHNGGTSAKLAFAGGAGGIPVVVGQRYKFYARGRSDNGSSVWHLGTTDAGAEIWSSELQTAIDTWETFEYEFVATTNRVHMLFNHSGSTDIYIDNVYLSAVSRRDLDTNWLALLDAATAQVDLYNINSNSFTAGLLDFGTVSSYVATIDTINFPTTKTITDSTSRFLNQGVQAGDIRVISGSALNNIAFVVEHVTTGTIRARGNPFVVDADDDGTITLTKYNPVAFHYVNEALRASPVDGGIALRPKHYSFANRTHLEGAGSSERKFSNWFLNDVGPVAPTDVEATTGNGDGAATNLTAGAGFEIGITRTADDGDWIAGTYIIACAFRYDEGQVSALFVPSTDEEFGTAILDSDSLTLTVRAKNDYDERISGGYIFCRKDESDDAWTLLAEISMAEGARATLLGTYNAWAESSTADVAYTANFKSLHPNVDSYESISGIDPTNKVETFSSDNAFWNASVIGGNRCFIFAPRYTDAGGNLQQFRDRVMYSQVNAYDTFPIDNIIDVVKGDAEDYVMGGIYGNTLLAFKSRTLYLIDISDPDPAGWQMKQDANKGKYPRRGLAHPGAYFETPHGPAWCNEFGVFLYNGSEIVPLLGDKIELSEHPLAYQRYMEFEGTDDYVQVADDGDIDFGTTSDFSLEAWIKTSTSVDCGIINKRVLSGNFEGYSLVITGSTGKATFGLYNSAAGTGSALTGATAVNDGEWHHIVCVSDRSTGNYLYLDGALDNSNATATTVDLDSAQVFDIGKQGTDEFPGDISGIRVWNRVLSTAEALALYNGQPVLAADQWGQQGTYTSDFTAGANGWVGVRLTTAGNIDGVTDGVTSKDNCLRFTCTADNNTHYSKKSTIAGLAVGDIVTVSFDYYIPSGQSNVDGFEIADGTSTIRDLASTGATPATLGTWTRLTITDFTLTDTDIQVAVSDGATQTFADAGADDLMYIVNMTISIQGCVAEYAPKGIGDATWEDQSTNSLDGTVVGATAIFEDSWAKFWTNYSILGHHERTNQLIIMRDCTGKWSSGQDYGDCWTIDLDTMASTTGRRVFTKGIAYSNWATDWKQELIIAEQTSSTSVTIKQWTDEPQSQAAGLIDIRTADFDFGNPAYAKIFDALVAYYKSSAAQTTPVSYALDGDDRNVAWTRITGNFAAEGFWEKLSLQPTPITVDTIRFKLGNPTNPGILELNDLTLRYQTEEEDID